MHTGPEASATTSDTGVVIPVRSFVFGKARLASALDAGARLALMQHMADAVINAAGTRPTVVVTSAPEVIEWCAARGVVTIDDPGSLDAAADAGRAWAAQLGLHRIVVAHADLPNASSLDGVATAGAARAAVLVPDRHDDGTPVLSVPVDADFEFAYGPGSFARHIEAARHAQLEVVVVRDPGLGFDVDVAEDLADMEAVPRADG
jgi:2-phospho-L-lactate guanylyltransferase